MGVAGVLGAFEGGGFGVVAAPPLHFLFIL